MPGTSGWSGKKIAVATVVSLLLVGSTVAYVLWIYAELDRARAETETNWRAVAAELDVRYAAIESQLSAIDAGTFSDDFRTAVDNFRTLSRRRTQEPAATAVEKVLASGQGWTLPDDLEQQSRLQLALDAFNRSQARERQILDSLGGRVLDLVLNFANTEELILAQPPSAAAGTANAGIN